jgi:hypothetical protein
MKVLLIGIPRSGTKILQSYIHQYLLAKGPTATIDRWKNGLDEMLAPFGHRTNQFASIDQYGNVSFDDKRIVDPVEEVNRRIVEIIQPLTYNCVVKHPPIYGELTQRVTNAFDKVIVLKRRNSIDVALSTIIAIHSNVYSRTLYRNEIENTITEFVNNPFKADVKMFTDTYNKNESFIKDEFSEYYQHPDITTVDYEEVCTVNNSTELCSLLNFEKIDFDLKDFYLKEYTVHKETMISNMNELLESIGKQNA